MRFSRSARGRNPREERRDGREQSEFAEQFRQCIRECRVAPGRLLHQWVPCCLWSQLFVQPAKFRRARIWPQRKFRNFARKLRKHKREKYWHFPSKTSTAE